MTGGPSPQNMRFADLGPWANGHRFLLPVTLPGRPLRLIGATIHRTKAMRRLRVQFAIAEAEVRKLKACRSDTDGLAYVQDGGTRRRLIGIYVIDQES